MSRKCDKCGDTNKKGKWDYAGREPVFSCFECVRKLILSRSGRRATKRFLAWAIEHDSHGISLDTVGFLPEDENPETNHQWVRLPWLDEPKRKE